jgi:EAL domain-containing protein (putative c-di-GMP-specific phosphodiesterase class I)
MAPSLLELEITESAVMADVQKTAILLRELKSLGLSISLDDFGTGHSSLAYLKELPVDTIKIDQAFIRCLAKDPADVNMVQAMISMSNGLGIKTIAEGVEDHEAFSILKRMGCDIGQGYYFCRPKPVEEITLLLKSAQAEIESKFDPDILHP